MSADGVLVAANARIDINGEPYGTVSGSWSVKRQKVDRTDTEQTESTRCKLSPLRTLTLSNIVAQRADDVNYHSAPTNLTSVSGISINIWPNGRADPAGPISVTTLLIEEVGGDWNISGGGGQPQTITISRAESDGDFTLPGE